MTPPDSAATWPSWPPSGSARWLSSWAPATRAACRRLVAAAAECELPLIAFERETQFIEITEAVHARIIDAQLAELRSAERLHQAFTELAVSGASAEEVVAQTATLAGCPAILANLAHQVLACAPLGRDAAVLLSGFSAGPELCG